MRRKFFEAKNGLQERGLTAKRGKKRTAPKPRLVEVCMDRKEGSSQSPQAAVRISLPGGATIEIEDRGQVNLAADLLKALAGSSPC